MRGRFIFGLLIFCLVGVLFVKPSFAWLSGWDFRQAINISNTAGDLTNYQVRIDLNSSNVGSHFNWSNNGSDIRFTDASDNLLNFWIESWNSTGQKAIIWVNVTSLPNNTNTTVYLYYGNSEASSASDGEATFEFFDDFLGTSLNTTKWPSIEGHTPTYSVSNSELYIEPTDTTWTYFVSNFQWSTYPMRFIFKAYTDGYYSDEGAFGICEYYDSTSSNAGGQAVVNQDEIGFLGQPSADYNDIGTTFTDFSNYHIYTVIESSTTNREISTDTGASYTGTKDYSSIAKKLVISVLRQKTHYDYVFVTKYADPEPTVSSFGGEEIGVGIIINVYDNQTNQSLTNWTAYFTNGTDEATFTNQNNPSSYYWKDIPYGEINITISDGSDTKYYYNYTFSTINNETNLQTFDIYLEPKGNNTITLTATPSWSIIETQQVQITCIAEEGTPHLYMNNVEISNPYTGQPTAGTYSVVCNVSETANYRPTTESNTLTVSPLIACTNNETFAFSAVITTSTNITTLNFTKFVEQHFVKDDLSDVYVPNVSNVWKNTTNGYYIVVNNTNLTNFTVYFGNYYAHYDYSNHAIANVQNISAYQQENIYVMFRFLDEVTGQEMYPPNTSEVVLYISCPQGSNYVTIEENDSQFLIAFTGYPSKLLVRVQYSVENYYSRSLYPAEQRNQYLVSFYLIDAYKYYTDKVNFVMLSSDYYDAKFQIYKKISNQTIIITEGYFDQMRTFPSYLIEDHDYYLRLIKGSEIRDIGTFTVTSAGTQYLDVSQVVLSPSVSLFSDKVTFGAVYNESSNTIRIQYIDLTNQTINITVSVYNNTGLYFQQTYYSSNFTITLNDVPKNQSWYVKYTLYHQIYGNSPIMGSVSLIAGILLPIGVALWMYPLISFFILFLTSSIITPRNIVGGILSVFVLMYLLYYIGWLSLTTDAIVIISVILIMGLLLHLRSRGEAL